MLTNRSLVIQAISEASESFTDLLQIIIFESHALTQCQSVDSETTERAAKIARAAREAASLVRLLLGQTD